MIENVLVDHEIINLIKMKGTDLSPEKRENLYYYHETIGKGASYFQ